MEDYDNTSTKNKTGGSNGLTKHIDTEWSLELTVLDLSHRNIATLDENVNFPPKLVKLDLSHNNLIKIPSAVMKIETLQELNVSYNKIVYFDDTPSFCHCIERLNLSENALQGLPYWVWFESPSKLTELDLSCNLSITKALEDWYFKELLQHTTLVTDIKLYNCRLQSHIELMKTFPKAKVVEVGSEYLSYLASNHLDHIPCVGLDQCCDIERLILCNTHLYTIKSNIDIYKNLIEINLSHNNLDSLPNEFCNLENLEVCIMSCNSILYLPEDMIKLKNLVCLRLDSNELCMISDDIGSLPKLKMLDLYDNCLPEVPNGVKRISELDLAQNFMEEPDDIEYMEKRGIIRLNVENRKDGRKIEVTKSEGSYSPDASEDEELINYLNNMSKEAPQPTNDPPSSPEDWDSDKYWVPSNFLTKPSRPNQHQRSAPWLNFVKKKMQEGNFCPMDIHAVSVTEKVKYEKMINPRVWHEVEGQFDDYSDGDS